MRNAHLSITLLIGTLVLCSSARAERWFDMGTNAAVRPELASAFAACVDLDSVKTDKKDWTSYHWKLCTDARELFQAAVQCDGNFAAEQIPIRQRTIIKNSRPTPHAPWTTTDIYVSSMSGKMAARVCHK